MNIFRLAGDMSHLLSILVILLKITATRSCRGAAGAGQGGELIVNDLGGTGWLNVPAAALAGISLKTQELYLLVFVTRYLDLFTNFVSL